MIASWYDSLRHRHSAKSLILRSLTLMLLLSGGVMASKHFGGFNSQLNAWGNYINDVKMYITYSYRVLSHDDTNAQIIKPSERVWATIEGMLEDGRAVIRLWGQAVSDEKDVVQSSIVAEFADLDLLDIRKAAVLVNEYKRKQVKVDYYVYELNGEKHASVVIWHNELMINAKLIEIMAAEPHDNPPTNITNTLMQAYYRGRL